MAEEEEIRAATAAEIWIVFMFLMNYNINNQKSLLIEAKL
jgi:hypothetical protein